MKVQELIAELSKRDPKLEVLIPGADGGLSDIRDAVELRVIFEACAGGYCGPHHEDNYSDVFEPDLQDKGAYQGKALILRRK